MSPVRVGPSVCHQSRGSLPAEQEERGHRPGPGPYLHERSVKRLPKDVTPDRN